MNRYKYDAYVQEFPFLSEIFAHLREAWFEWMFTPSDLRSVRVQRFDENLLNRVLRQFRHDNDSWLTEALWAVAIGGTVQQVPVERETLLTSVDSHFRRVEEKGGRLIQALAGFEHAEFFVLTSHERTPNPGGTDHSEVVVFKPSKKFDLAEKVTEERVRSSGRGLLISRVGQDRQFVYVFEQDEQATWLYAWRQAINTALEAVNACDKYFVAGVNIYWTEAAVRMVTHERFARNPSEDSSIWAGETQRHEYTTEKFAQEHPELDALVRLMARFDRFKGKKVFPSVS